MSCPPSLHIWCHAGAILSTASAPRHPTGDSTATRAAVWRDVGTNGNAHLLRNCAAATCAVADADAADLIDDVLLALRHDPPRDAPAVALAVQCLGAFLAAEPAGSFARNTRTELLREAVSADILARLPGIA